MHSEAQRSGRGWHTLDPAGCRILYFAWLSYFALLGYPTLLCLVILSYFALLVIQPRRDAVGSHRLPPSANHLSPPLFFFSFIWVEARVRSTSSRSIMMNLNPASRLVFSVPRSSRCSASASRRCVNFRICFSMPCAPWCHGGVGRVSKGKDAPGVLLFSLRRGTRSSSLCRETPQSPRQVFP